MIPPPRDDERTACNESVWNAVADQPHRVDCERALAG